MGRIADAYAVDGRTNFAISTTPARRVEFRGAHADINFDVDMPPVLRTGGIVVEVRPDWVDWISQWMQACGDPPRGPKAEVRLPPGFLLGSAPEYELIRMGINSDADAETKMAGGEAEQELDFEFDLDEPKVEPIRRRGRPPKKGW